MDIDQGLVVEILRRARDATPQDPALPQHFDTPSDKLAEHVCWCKDRGLVFVHWRDLMDGPVWHLNGISIEGKSQLRAFIRTN